MKQYLLFIIISAILLWNTPSKAAYEGRLGDDGGANPNPHNLSSLSANAVRALDTVSQSFPGRETQICVFCHTPHGAVANAPLWNRPDPDYMGSFLTRPGLDSGISNATIITNTLYDDTSGDYPNGASKLCLSCHDGVTAIGIVTNGDSIDMTFPNLASSPSKIELTTSHPISFVYNSDVKNFLGAAYIWPTTAYLDSSSRVQCTICHQPHQDTQGFGGGIYPFWRVGSGSLADYNTVCESCHTTPVPAALPSEHNF